MQNGTNGFLSRKQLVQMKIRAIRSGVWFKALPRIDRVLIELTIKVADNVRSISLAKSIFAVVGKLEGLLENSAIKSLRQVGYHLAEKLSLVAQKLGNSSAKKWANDSSFAFFLAIMHTNR